MNLSQQLRKIRNEAEIIGQQITGLEHQQALACLEPSASMNPTRPLHRSSRSVSFASRYFSFTFTAAKTSSATEAPVRMIRVVKGLNQLDAEVHLRQKLRKEGLFIRTMISKEPA